MLIENNTNTNTIIIIIIIAISTLIINIILEFLVWNYFFSCFILALLEHTCHFFIFLSIILNKQDQQRQQKLDEKIRWFRVWTMKWYTYIYIK